MMKPYTEYKPSGVNWLGEIPKEWDIIKLNNFTPIITCGVAATPKYVNHGIPFLSAQNVKMGKVDLTKGHKYITKDFHRELTKNRLPKNGDILLTRVGTIGEVGIINVDFEFSVFVSLTHIRLDQKVCLNTFFKYLFESKYVKELNYIVTLTGAGVGNLNVNDLRQYRLPIPSLVEQKYIVNYLDRETSRIDTLIAEKENFIQLLKEKRQALISHVVTKGLDDSVSMKGSGVKGLGSVPSHWKVPAIKHIVSIPICDGPHVTPVFQDSGIPFVSAEAIKNGKIDFGKIRGFITEEDHKEFSKKYYPLMHDVYMIKSGNTTGNTAIVETNDVFNIWSPLAVFRAGKYDNSYYIYYALQATFFQTQVELKSSYGTQPNIGMGVIENLKIPLPPQKEQNEIVDYIEIKTGEITKLMDEGLKSITLLKEYRSALISAAVTGKIDVREEI